MFSFDEWGDYANERAIALAREGVAAAFKDGRQSPEIASNPSYAVEVSTSERLGYISFWKNGLCDMEVMDSANNTMIGVLRCWKRQTLPSGNYSTGLCPRSARQLPKRQLTTKARH